MQPSNTEEESLASCNWNVEIKCERDIVRIQFPPWETSRALSRLGARLNCRMGLWKEPVSRRVLVSELSWTYPWGRCWVSSVEKCPSLLMQRSKGTPLPCQLHLVTVSQLGHWGPGVSALWQTLQPLECSQQSSPGWEIPAFTQSQCHFSLKKLFKFSLTSFPPAIHKPQQVP